MNAFTLLKTDHKKVAGLLEDIDDTTEKAVKTRETLFTQLKNEMDTHAFIEETILYPALKEHEETRDIVLEGFEEHRIVKELLVALDDMKKGDEVWTAKFTVLKENIEHHVEEEEDEMFTKARKVLSKDEVESLGTRMETAKQTKKQVASVH